MSLGDLVYEAWLSLGPRRAHRRALWKAAHARAQSLHRPLLVLGDPDGGVVNAIAGRDYGCGDLCIDLSGCPRCPHGIGGRAEEVLPQVPSASHVVFVSCTLEYIEPIAQVFRELDRVSGGELFVAHVEPESLTSRLYPGARWRIWKAPPAGEGDLVYSAIGDDSRRILKSAHSTRYSRRMALSGFGTPVTVNRAGKAAVTRSPEQGCDARSRRYRGRATQAEKISPRQARGYEELARGAGSWFVTDKEFPAPQDLVRYQNLNAALRHCRETAYYSCPVHVLRPCSCDWRDCSKCPTNCWAPPISATQRIPGFSGHDGGCGCRCMRIGGQKLRRIAKVDRNGAVYYVTRGGEYKMINAPSAAAASLRCDRATTGIYREAAERAARMYAAADPGLRGRPTYLCDDFGQPCLERLPGEVPVVYAHDGAVVRRYDDRPTGATTIDRVSPAEFKYLVSLSWGGGAQWP